MEFGLSVSSSKPVDYIVTILQVFLEDTEICSRVPNSFFFNLTLSLINAKALEIKVWGFFSWLFQNPKNSDTFTVENVVILQVIQL